MRYNCNRQDDSNPVPPVSEATALPTVQVPIFCSGLRLVRSAQNWKIMTKTPQTQTTSTTSTTTMSATTKKYFFQIQFRLFLYPLARSVFDLRKVIDTQVGLLPPVSWDVPKTSKISGRWKKGRLGRRRQIHLLPGLHTLSTSKIVYLRWPQSQQQQH